MTDNNKPFEPVDLSPQLQRQSREEGSKWMQEHEKRFAYLTRKSISNPLEELNVRMMQYRTQPYTIEFKIVQTVRDFSFMFTEMQIDKESLDLSKPVAVAKIDGLKTKIYFDSDKGIFFVK